MDEISHRLRTPELEVPSMGVRRGETGICPPLEIATKKKKFLENVKSGI